MKILMVDGNPAAKLLVDELRKYGHHVDCVNMSHDKDEGVLFNYCKQPFSVSLMNLVGLGLLEKNYDVVHKNFGLWCCNFDVLFFKLSKKAKLVVHYRGSETRERYGLNYRSLVDACIVSTPDLLKYHPEACWIPNMMPIVKEPVRSSKTQNIHVVHMTTNRGRKGSDFICKVMKGLTELNIGIRFTFVEKMHNSEALKILDSADILIDKIDTLGGSLGVRLPGHVAYEAWGRGIPVVCDLDERYDDLYGRAVEYADMECLRDVILSLCDNSKRRYDLAVAGQDFLAEYCSPERVVERVLEVYEK